MMRDESWDTIVSTEEEEKKFHRTRIKCGSLEGSRIKTSSKRADEEKSCGNKFCLWMHFV